MAVYSDLLRYDNDKKQGNATVSYGGFIASGCAPSGTRVRADAATNYDKWYADHSGKFRTQIFVSSSSGA